MSLTKIIIVKKDTITMTDMNYRQLERILRRGKKGFESIWLSSTKKYLDEGYMLVDLDSKTIFNSQLGIQLPKQNEFCIYEAS